MINRAGSRKLIRWTIIGFVLFAVLGYGIFAFRDIARGPSITITEPTNGETYATSTVELKGTAVRTQYIALNGRPILIDENGNFNEHILLSSGFNVVVVEARDRFGHTTTSELSLIRSTPHELSKVLEASRASSTATSTASTTPRITLPAASSSTRISR